MGADADGYRLGVEGFRAKYLEALVKEFQPSLVLAFGSRVRGDNLKGSDLDLVIVSEAFEEIPFPNRAFRVLEGLDIMEAMDLLCYTEEEFERKKEQIGIVRIAVREGLVIYQAEVKERENGRTATGL